MNTGHSRKAQKKRVKNKRCTKEQPHDGNRKHNKNQKINRWNIVHMKGAVNEYMEKNGAITVRQLAYAWRVPRSTLQIQIDG